MVKCDQRMPLLLTIVSGKLMSWNVKQNTKILVILLTIKNTSQLLAFLPDLKVEEMFRRLTNHSDFWLR